MKVVSIKKTVWSVPTLVLVFCILISIHLFILFEKKSPDSLSVGDESYLVGALTFYHPTDGESIDASQPVLVEWGTNPMIASEFTNFQWRFKVIDENYNVVNYGLGATELLPFDGIYQWDIANTIKNFWISAKPHERYRLEASLWYAGDVPFSCGPGSSEGAGCLPVYPEPVHSSIIEARKYASYSGWFTLKNVPKIEVN